MKRSVFFRYWSNFKRIGLVGLIDKKKGGLRQAKVQFDQEARLVIDRLQHPHRSHEFYLQRLRHVGVVIKQSRLSQIFNRWNLKDWNYSFDSDLNRLE